MKRLFRGIVILSFITIICVIVYFLLFALKKMYIESWFFFDRSVIIGFLSGLVLTLIISLVNYRQALCDHARERAALLDEFTAEAASFSRTMGYLQNNDSTFTIPDQMHPELERALAQLDDRAGKIVRCERISPLQRATIEKRGVCATKNAKAELAFDLAFEPFAESCSIAFHAHGVLPYLEDGSILQDAQEDFLRHLKQVFDGLKDESAMRTALRTYREKIDRFLCVRQPKKQNA